MGGFRVGTVGREESVRRNCLGNEGHVEGPMICIV